jgi:hypothetical protein
MFLAVSNRAELAAVLRRARDSSESVRKYVYAVVQDKVDVASLSVQQRVDLLQDGLTDRCATCCCCSFCWCFLSLFEKQHNEEKQPTLRLCCF